MSSFSLPFSHEEKLLLVPGELAALVPGVMLEDSKVATRLRASGPLVTLSVSPGQPWLGILKHVEIFKHFVLGFGRAWLFEGSEDVLTMHYF